MMSKSTDEQLTQVLRNNTWQNLSKCKTCIVLTQQVIKYKHIYIHVHNIGEVKSSTAYKDENIETTCMHLKMEYLNKMRCCLL